MKIAIDKDDLSMVQHVHNLHPEPLDVPSLATAIEFGTLETVQWVIANRHDRRCCLPGIESLCRSCFLSSLPKIHMRDADRVLPWVLGADAKFQVKDIERRYQSLGLVRWLDERVQLTESNAQELILTIASRGPPTSEPVLWYLIDRGFSVCEDFLVSAMAAGSANPALESVLDVVINSRLCDSFRDKFVFAPIRPGGIKVLQWDSEYMETAPPSWRGTLTENLRAHAGSHGHVDLVKWLCSTTDVKLTAKPILLPVSDDNALATYQLMRQAGVRMDIDRLTEEVVREGRLRVARWLWDQRTNEPPSYPYYMALAAVHGQLHVMRWLHEKHTDRCGDRAMYLAAQNGHLEVVQWLHDNTREGCAEEALQEAAYYGHFDVVKWLATNRREVGGHVEILDWLFENRDYVCVNCLRKSVIQRPFQFSYHERELNRPITVRDSLLWMREHELQSPHCTGACLREHNQRGKPLVVQAVEAGDAPLLHDLIEWHSNECSRREAAETAAEYGRLSLLQWLYEMRTEEWDFTALASAAAWRRRLSVVEWLHRAFSDRVDWVHVRATAKNGKHNRLVKWLDANVENLSGN